MDAAGRDVGRHQRRHLPVLELGEGPGALRLGLAAVQSGGPHPALQQLLHQPVHPVLGVQEHDDPAVARRDLDGRALLVLVVHVQDVVLHRGDGTGRGVDGVDHRVRQVAADQPVDVAVEGGREQHPLPVRLHLVEQGGDLRHEAHVGHLVGLVQHRDGDVAEGAVAAVDEVLEPSGRRDDDLRPGAQRPGLPADRHAADHGGRPEADGAGVRAERVGDLLGQLTGGDEDQAERTPRLGALAGRAGQQGETEGERLARAGAAAAEYVPSGQGVRQGRRLDRERHAHALVAEGGQHAGREVEFGERLDGGQRRGDRLRQRELAALGGGGRTAAGVLGPAGRPGATGGFAGASAVVGACAVHGEPSSIRHVSRETRSGRAAQGIARTSRPGRFRRGAPSGPGELVNCGNAGESECAGTNRCPALRDRAPGARKRGELGPAPQGAGPSCGVCVSVRPG